MMNKDINKKNNIELTFERYMNDFTELIESGMYSIVDEYSINGFDEFDGMIVMSIRINSEISIFIVYQLGCFEEHDVFIGNEDKRVVYNIEIEPAFYSYAPRDDKILACLMATLDWWEENQFNELSDCVNQFKDAPEFVTLAMLLWGDIHGNNNPNNWMWLNH